MNQILSTEIPKPDNKYRGSGEIQIKKIIIFFAVALILIGIAIAGVYFYKLKEERTQEVINEPQVLVEVIEDSVKIVATSETGINKIEYSFDDADVTNIQVNGKTSIEKLINKPLKAKKIKVTLVDVNGQEKVQDKQFEAVDTEKPKVKAEVAMVEDETKLKISAEDDSGLEYLTYKWIDGEEIRVDATEEKQKVIEVSLDIERMEKDMIITAEDIYGNIETVTKTIVGKYVPEIKVVQYGDKVECIVSHDKGFEKIVFNVNGNEMSYDETKQIYDKELTEFKCSISLKSGENIIEIHAYSLEGTEKVFKGKCGYTPEV